MSPDRMGIKPVDVHAETDRLVCGLFKPVYKLLARCAGRGSSG